MKKKIEENIAKHFCENFNGIVFLKKTLRYIYIYILNHK